LAAAGHRRAQRRSGDRFAGLVPDRALGTFLVVNSWVPYIHENITGIPSYGHVLVAFGGCMRRAEVSP
jgi:hypothetical protein